LNKQIIEKAAETLYNEAVDALRRLVNINSFSGNSDGLDNAARLIQDIAEHLNLPIVPVRPTAEFKNRYHLIYDGGPSNGRPFFGILGHFDTVHRPDSHFNSFQETAGRFYGPGIFDMKSGIIAALYALFIIKKSIGRNYLPVKIIFNCDEETGSKSSRQLIEREMEGASGVFVFEGRNDRDHAVVTAREGILMGSMAVKGVAAHCGLDPQKGASAIVEAAHKIIALDRLTDHSSGTVVTTGKINGGQVANQIPDLCCSDIDIRLQTSEQETRIRAKVAEIMSATTVMGTSATYDLVCARPPFSKTQRTQALLNQYLQAAAEFNLKLCDRSSGGGSDANFTAAMGIPTLDSLGPEGRGAHTDHEYIIERSLHDSIKVFALFLAYLIEQ
jgi:glutamate carboxypeptidase